MFEVPLHTLINHFPIALAVFAFVFDAWAVYAKRPAGHDAGYALSLWAGLLAMVSVVTGLMIAGLGGINKGAITGHALYGMSTAIILAGFGLWRYSIRARQPGPEEDYSPLWLVIQGLAAVLVLAAAVTGHKLF